MNSMILYYVPFWLLLFLVGLPQFSETIYVPSLPSIADALKTSANMIEYTLSIYLFGFACGTLFWGRVSDRYGRKPCIVLGLVFFIIGCVGCYFSTTVEALLFSRFVQAFGGSVGSVIGQAVCRDAFHGKELMRMFASIGSALALFPAIGPVIGGTIVSYMGYANIFLFLIIIASMINMSVLKWLPETHPKASRVKHDFFMIIRQLLHDKKVIYFGLLIGLSNGIGFSYFSEGSFYFIDILGLDPSIYGLTFLPIAFTYFIAGFIAKSLQKTYSGLQIIGFATKMVVAATAFLSGIIMLYNLGLICMPKLWNVSSLVYITLGCHMITCLGLAFIMVNALPLSLIDYKHCVGTASSLFGFGYYLIISLCTFILGFIRTGGLLSMPLYFFCLGIGTMFIYNRLQKIYLTVSSEVLS